MNEMKQLARIGTGGQAAAPRKSAPISKRQKAAIIVRLLLNEGAEVPLSSLPEDMQADLTQAMGAMRYVSRDTLAEVVGEFASELESIGLSFPGGIAGALDALDGRISRQTAARLRKDAGVRQRGDPWARIRALEPEQLLEFARGESVEIAAVMLSKLDIAQAADLLGRLPGELARRITYAVSLTGAVTPDAVERIGLSLAAQFDDRPLRAFDEPPEGRVGAILNYSPAMTRDDVLTGLDEADKRFADEVRKTIFTFADIPARIAPVDVPKVVRAVDPATLLRALIGAGEAGAQEAADYLLGHISRRMADGLREEMEEAGKVSARDGEAAMTDVVIAIRTAEAAGEIAFVQPDEPE